MRSKEELEKARQGRYAQLNNAVTINADGSSHPHITQVTEGESYEQQILEVLLDCRDILKELK